MSVDRHTDKQLTRWSFEMNGDDARFEEDSDGVWVYADEALGIIGAYQAECERLRRDAEEWKANWQNATQLVESHRRDALTEAGHAIAAEARVADAVELLRDVPGLCGIGVEEWQHRRRTLLASAQPASPARRYALNFCSMCGSRLDCEDCAEPPTPSAELARRGLK